MIGWGTLKFDSGDLHPPRREFDHEERVVATETPKLLAEDAVLRQKVVDYFLLMAAQPAGRGQDNDLESAGHPANLPDTEAARRGLFLKALEVSADFSHPTGMRTTTESDPAQSFQSVIWLRPRMVHPTKLTTH